MANKNGRRALGRGLTNLIPQGDDTNGTDNANEIVMVDVSAITVNPYQPRQDFDTEEIAALAESIRAQGLLQPILLRKRTDGYQIISGERRFRALQKLGNKAVPALVRTDISDRDMLEMALVENVQRENLNEIEKALAYERLLLECGLSHEELSERVGVSRSAVTNSLRLLKLPEPVQRHLRFGRISAGHARALVALESEAKQIDLANRIVDDRLSVRQVEQLSQDQKKSGKKPKPVARPADDYLTDPDVQNILQKIRYRFGTRIEVKRERSGRGHVRVEFMSNDDLSRVLELLGG